MTLVLGSGFDVLRSVQWTRYFCGAGLKDSLVERVEVQGLKSALGVLYGLSRVASKDDVIAGTSSVLFPRLNTLCIAPNVLDSELDDAIEEDDIAGREVVRSQTASKLCESLASLLAERAELCGPLETLELPEELRGSARVPPIRESVRRISFTSVRHSWP